MANSPRDDQPTSSAVTRMSNDRHDPEVRSEVPDQDVLALRERLGDFRLIRQIGHGGMGVVYEAEQLSLARKVAVKVLPFASMLNPQHRKRFHNEARAAATLDHPHIVPVYFVGEERGVHFYAMHLIDGLSMADLIAMMRGEFPRPQAATENAIDNETEVDRWAGDHPIHTTISTQRSKHRRDFFLTVARLGAEAAEALEHAHQVGILHRDIKPGNLMIDNNGKLWVTDFGLASIEHGETLTRTGGIVGTAAYMSPEQAKDSHRVDNRSDIYSLGTTLYELLTLSRHRSDEPTRAEGDVVDSAEMMEISNGPASLPADLETIILKALSIEPDDRYHTAQQMADDLRAFIDGRDIKARRLSVVQRTSRLLRRHRRWTTAAIALSFLLIAGFGTIMWFYSRQLSDHARELERALTDAKASRIHAEQQAAIARRQVERAERSEWDARASEIKARESEQLAKASELATRRMHYRSDMRNAYDNFSRNMFADAGDLLAKQIPRTDQADLRGVEWHLLNAEVGARLIRLGSHDGEGTECVLFPDGKTVATAGTDGVIKIWDVDRRQLRDTFEPKIGPIHALAISPDGQTLAVAGAVSTVTLGIATVHLLDASTGRRKIMSQTHRTTIESIAFSSDGQKIAAASRYGNALLTTTEGKHLHAFTADTRNGAVAFSPDGRYLATRLMSDKIRIWDCHSGESIADVRCRGRADCICWSPAHDFLISASNDAGSVEVTDTRTWTRAAILVVPDPPPLGITSLQIADHGQTVLAGDVVGQVHRWSIGAEPIWHQANREGQPDQIEADRGRRGVDMASTHGLAGLSDGRVISVHHNGDVQLFVPNEWVAQIHTLDFAVSAVARYAGAALCLGTTDGSIHRFDISTGRSSKIMQRSESSVDDLALSGDGSKLAVVYDSRCMELIDTSSQQPLWTQSKEYRDSDPDYRVAISSDGRLLARAGSDHQLSVWDTQQNRSLLHRSYPGSGRSVALSPSGECLAHGRDGVSLIGLPAGKSLFQFAGEAANTIRFSADGRATVSGHDDGSVRLFDLESGTEKILRGHTTEVCSVVFDKDRRTVLSANWGGQGNTLRLWDADSGKPYGAIPNPLVMPAIQEASACKIIVLPDQIVLCCLGAATTQIAVWDLRR